MKLHASPLTRIKKRLILTALCLSTFSMGFGADQGLGRTWAKLERDKELTIGYFGGSLTAGAGSSKGNSWRELTTEWFKKNFPNAKIQEANAAIGGTGAKFGAYRCKHNLLSKRPNLVFVEFAVNDAAVKEDAGVPAMEGIVRQIWQTDPAADIVFVYTTMKKADVYGQGQVPPTVAYHQKVADYYGIATVNIGKALSQAIQNSNGTWEKFSKDGVHHNNDGYRIYADTVASFLESHRSDRAVDPVTPLPKPLSADPLETTKVVDPWDLEAAGWTKENSGMGGQFKHRIASNTPGSELTLSFTGPAIGIYRLAAPDGGNFEYSIDGGPAEEAVTWSSRPQPWPHFKMLREDLSPGSHVLRIKVLDKKDEKSMGNWVRIGAFFTR